eukprot:scaffold3531_cov279-Prasinococcus_capsulatus_cf.AAC.3
MQYCTASVISSSPLQAHRRGCAVNDLSTSAAARTAAHLGEGSMAAQASKMFASNSQQFMLTPTGSGSDAITSGEGFSRIRSRHPCQVQDKRSARRARVLSLRRLEPVLLRARGEHGPPSSQLARALAQRTMAFTFTTANLGMRSAETLLLRTMPSRVKTARPASCRRTAAATHSDTP